MAIESFGALASAVAAAIALMQRVARLAIKGQTIAQIRATDPRQIQQGAARLPTEMHLSPSQTPHRTLRSSTFESAIYSSTMAADAATNTGTMPSQHVDVKTDGAPAAIGPYSQAVIANGFVFVSGCIGLVPGDESKTLAATVTEQADQALKNMAAVLDAAGSSMHKVVKTTVLLRDMAAFGDVNKVYSAAFEGAEILPARAAYAVAGLPLDALVEIEAVALA